MTEPLKEFTNDEVLHALLAEGRLHKKWRRQALFMLALWTVNFLVTWWAYGNPMYVGLLIAGLCNFCYWGER